MTGSIKYRGRTYTPVDDRIDVSRLRFVATDLDGDVYGYEEEPFLKDTYFDTCGLSIPLQEVRSNWQKSVEEVVYV